MTQPPKSRFITILSIVSIAAAFYFIFQNISTLLLQNSAEFQIVRELMPSVMISPSAILFEIFLNMAAIIASLGLYLRRNWGRIMYMAVLSLVTLWDIYSSITTYLAFETMVKGYNLGGSLSLILLWAVLGLGITIYLLWKLSSENIRMEF